MSELRIAMAIATSGGGVGNHVRSLSAGLDARGHRVAVIGPPATEDRFGFTAAGARFAPVDVGARPRPASDLAAIGKLRRMLAGVDVVHAHGIRAGALCALAQASPLIVTLHNAPPAVSGPLGLAFPVLERVVARRADLVLGVSGDLVERMRLRGAKAVERALVPAPAMPPPDRAAAEVRSELGVAQDRPLLLVVARLAEQKGLPTLLEAAALWARRDPAPFVAIAGDGPLEADLAARIAEGGLPVRLLGRRTDVPDLLAAADAFVLPSVWEGQPLVLQEALRARLPIVATRVGGVPDVVRDAGLLVPAGDASALADAVGRVLDEPATAGRLRTQAALMAETLPTEDDTVEQVLSLYRRLAARNGAVS